MCGARVLVVEHQGNAGLGLLTSCLVDGGLELETVGPETGTAVPETLENYDGLIVLGGAVGPLEDDRAPWLPATRTLLAEGIERGIPTLGICLGAQLMVAASGGHVRTMPDGPEIGLHSVEFNSSAAEDPLFGGLSGSTVPAVQWHWLEADVLPAGASVLASNAACSNQAFSVAPLAWGVQFHPEVLARTAEAWTREFRQSLDDLGLDGGAVRREVRAAEPVLSETWSAIADRFAVIVRERAV